MVVVVPDDKGDGVCSTVVGDLLRTVSVSASYARVKEPADFSGPPWSRFKASVGVPAPQFSFSKPAKGPQSVAEFALPLNLDETLRGYVLEAETLRRLVGFGRGVDAFIAGPAES